MFLESELASLSHAILYPELVLALFLTFFFLVVFAVGVLKSPPVYSFDRVSVLPFFSVKLFLTSVVSPDGFSVLMFVFLNPQSLSAFPLG